MHSGVHPGMFVTLPEQLAWKSILRRFKAIAQSLLQKAGNTDPWIDVFVSDNKRHAFVACARAFAEVLLVSGVLWLGSVLELSAGHRPTCAAPARLLIFGMTTRSVEPPWLRHVGSGQSWNE